MKQLSARRSTFVLLAMAAACSFASYARSRVALSTHRASLLGRYAGRDESSRSTTSSEGAAGSADDHHRHPLDEADFIVRKSYAETYGRMHRCEDRLVEKECIALVADRLEGETRNHNATESTDAAYDDESPARYFRVPRDRPYPWWFRTLLRDVPSNGAYGFWHHFSTTSTDPRPIRFCAIGKNGSTEWRKVFRQLNAPELCEGGVVGGGCKSGFNTKTELSKDPKAIPNAVFLRDPLERLLSGYLDKCVKPGVRLSQGHCAPNDIFGVDFLERKAIREKQQQGGKEQKQRGKRRQRREQREKTEDDEEVVIPPDLTTVVQDMDREMFAAYVDLLPLQWNVHFVPQAIFCDLYRTIDDYDFVGVMGKFFMSELDRMADRYGGMLPDVLDDVFRYRSSLRNQSTAAGNVGSEKAHGTRAPEKVARYYSAGTVRRALEYLSIDYATLGLEVPGWAREMLREDA